MNEYKDGKSQRPVLAINSRRRWRQAKRVTPAALWNFFDARNGSVESFYFYDPYDRIPKFLYDPTGVITIGRYIVRFNGDWQQPSGPGRANVDVELLEVV